MYKLIKKVIKYNILIETFQALELKFSFGRMDTDKNVKQIHAWVKCRDYFGDVLMSNSDGQKRNIYGFTYDPEIDIPVHVDNLVMLLQFPNEGMKETFLNNKVILDNIDKKNQQPPAVIEETDDKKVLMLVASPFWQQNIITISFYTYILKIMCAEYTERDNWQQEIKKHSSWPEARYADRLGDNLPIICDHIYNIYKNDFNITGFGEDCKIEHLHNYSGFVTVCCNEAKKSTLKENTHEEEYKKYVAGLSKATKRVTNKPKKVAKALNPTAPACC